MRLTKYTEKSYLPHDQCVSWCALAPIGADAAASSSSNYGIDHRDTKLVPCFVSLFPASLQKRYHVSRKRRGPAR